MEWSPLLVIAAATLVSEDLTCITVGLLIGAGTLDAFTGVVGCLAGIYLGDLALWLTGRVAGRSLLRLPWVANRLDDRRLADAARWLDRRGGQAILASRFLPGTRFALYVGCGMLGARPLMFAAWTLLAVALWVPAVVGGIALLGEALAGPLRAWVGMGWLVGPLAIAIWLTAGRVRSRTARPDAAASKLGRRLRLAGWRLRASIARLRHWEFWPPWAFYPPVLVWVGLLALRYGGLRSIAAANPGIPEGGFVGESKFDILARLPEAWTLPAFRVAPAGAGHDVEARLSGVQQELQSRGWSFPVVLKPDAGQRGVGVRLARSLADVQAYLALEPAAVLVQRYHPGPCEAGIFYYRMPGDARGRIFAITDKVFPTLEGDGRSTVEELIWRHPRYRFQARVFLRRHATDRRRVLAAGEVLPLALAGNHAQGTMFRDGWHLWTPALEARIESLARQFDGFFIGRFDVRYSLVDRFKAGDDLAIVELNGATSEATNAYDPSWSLLRAYRVLFRQWALVFRIGDSNRKRGHRPASATRLLKLAWSHLGSRPTMPVAD